MLAADMQELLTTLRALKPEIAARYKAHQMGLFGSCVRGEQIRTSDIDLLVDFTEGADLLDLVGLAQFLEQRLGRTVDVVPKNALRIDLRDSVLNEVIPI